MTPEQVQTLFEAAKSPLLNNAQRNQLTLTNPWTKTGPISDVMKSEVARINPVMAKEWIAESGASMSLAAAPASTKRRKKTPKAEAEDDLLANGRCSGLREQITCKILQGIRDKG